jgi:hypothetical protein
MNSLSKKFVDPCNKKNDDFETSRKFEKDSDVILKAGTILNPTITIPAATAVGTVFNLASVTLNTSDFRNSIIKLDFAANLVASAFVGFVAFKIVKQCDSQFQQSTGKVWTFGSSLTSPGLVTATTFSFFEFDGGNCCEECCTYTVVATVVGTTPTAGTLAINPISFGLLAVENSNKSRCCC